LIGWFSLTILEETRANRGRRGFLDLEISVEPASLQVLSTARVERQGDGHPLIVDAGFAGKGTPDGSRPDVMSQKWFSRTALGQVPALAAAFRRAGGVAGLG
jgi:hypothetical protein